MLHAFEYNKPKFSEQKSLILQIVLNFQKLERPLFIGHLGLSKGISPSQIGRFLIKIWPKELCRYRNFPNFAYLLKGEHPIGEGSQALLAERNKGVHFEHHQFYESIVAPWWPILIYF